jgi:hypothetical protein
MFFGGDPFAHAHGGGGGRGPARARPDVDTDKLYETLGVRYVVVIIFVICCYLLLSVVYIYMAIGIAVMSITKTRPAHYIRRALFSLLHVSSVTIHVTLSLCFSHHPLLVSITYPLI